MMTIQKLRTLRGRTCVRKTALLFHTQAQTLLQGKDPDWPYIEGLCSLFSSPQFLTVLSSEELSQLHVLASRLQKTDRLSLPFVLEDIHHALLAVLGSELSDWDFVDKEGALDADRRVMLEHVLILDRIRSPFNVGSIFRSADSFGVKEIWLVEGCASVEHPRCIKTARGCIETVKHSYLSEAEVLQRLSSENHCLFALELGGVGLTEFAFPREGSAVIGSEEMGVSPTLLRLCDQSLGRVSIELGGTKGSLNVSVASGIMLHSWYAMACSK